MSRGIAKSLKIKENSKKIKLTCSLKMNNGGKRKRNYKQKTIVKWDKHNHIYNYINLPINNYINVNQPITTTCIYE